MALAGVYLIRNLIDGRIYVGSTGNVKRRWRTHRKRLRSRRHINKPLQAAWLLYGEEAFSFELVEWVGDELRLTEREQYWMSVLRATIPDRGYNILNAQAVEIRAATFYAIPTTKTAVELLPPLLTIGGDEIDSLLDAACDNERMSALFTND